MAATGKIGIETLALQRERDEKRQVMEGSGVRGAWLDQGAHLDRANNASLKRESVGSHEN
jgi:hypothetical protein